MLNTAELLTEQMLFVAPVDGVSIGNNANKTTWRIDFKLEATPAQRAAAQAVVAAFNVTAEEQKLLAVEQAKKDTKTSLLSQLNKSVTVRDLLDLGLI